MRVTILTFTFFFFFQSLSGDPYFKFNPAVKQDTPTKCKEFFNQGRAFFDTQKWDLASQKFYFVDLNYPKFENIQETCFYLGMSQFHLGELAEANLYLTRYLKGESNPEYFREVIETKFAIAEQFRMGEKRRIYDSKRCPKWAGGEMLAIEIYDEIIATIPCDELAIQSLYSKGRVLFDIAMYNDAVTTLQTLIRRFPKNELSIEAYVLIEEIFVVQSEIEQQNSDILELARINLRHFEQDFPKEERINYAKELVTKIEGTFATSLFNIGQLYERKGQLEAAAIYYFQALYQFPKTDLAQECYKRIQKIAPKDVAEKCYAHLNK
jgi:outer membrane protein assembly factor BamD (BamD/ComL family)